MAAHPFGRVDDDRAVTVQGGREQLDAAVEKDGSVDLGVRHDAAGPIRSRDPPPLRPDTGEVRQGQRLRITATGQKSPGITSSSMSE
ncbi:hypothetical protein GCM10017586_04380 [Microbacterium imperiale]|uniref:Uncharacterized protein n=1 Tax=Microbacterium imperiale TaxID=33884 RepID=A0A9W6HE05_9MICO|nr:hypothetical protein GCM10017544_12230 [Microbacterium imperiale]GLJ78756.1 hypothetical protein GCM10017586_04380 [Microbacterium imperiale]